MQGLVALMVAALAAGVASADVAGRVYFDANRNGRADDGEPGVAGVSVSDGIRVVATDAEGRYRLAPAEACPLVWICVPRDRAASGPFWQTAASGRADFGLVERPQTDDFLFAQISDTHVGRADLVRRLGAHAAELRVPPAFVVNTGDLVAGVDVVEPDKARPQYDRYLEATSAFPVPLFNLPGNHEHVSTSLPKPDAAHPLYGKGLYRSVFGPTYYAWDWAGVHAVALDGTSLPYQERLGTNQLAWLAADLALQPAEKPLLLFCHQPVYALKDAKELALALQGRRVLGAFCGHLHQTFSSPFAGFPVYLTGAASGSWWSGPNIDGTPQGFRLVRVKAGALKTVYASREGDTPLAAVAPLASAVQTNDFVVTVSVVDFGRPVALSATFDGRPVVFAQSSREELWSYWQGAVGLAAACDGDRVLHVEARQGESVSTNEIRYLVATGRQQPYRAAAPAALRMQVRGVSVSGAVTFNGQPLGAIPAGTTNEATLSFPVSPDQLRKLNRVVVGVVGAARGKPPISVGPVWIDYRGKKIHDLRYASFERHLVGGGDPRRASKELYYCLP